MKSYVVETRGQAVVILGGQAELVDELINELSGLGVFATKVATIEELTDLQVLYDPDYLVIFEGGLPSELAPLFQSLVQSGESRLITVKRLGSATHSPPISPITKHILFSDYVGSNELSSPLLESWIKQVKTGSSLTIPGDGVGELSLLGLTDLSALLARAILHSPGALGEEIVLGNPVPISPLNLAYLLRTSLSIKINLSFDSESPIIAWRFDADLLNRTLKILNYDLTQDPQAILKQYFGSHLKSLAPTPVLLSPPPEPAQIPQGSPISIPPTKKLSPFKPPQPRFIPLASPKSKLTFAFKLSRRKTGIIRPPHIIRRGLVLALVIYLLTLIFAATLSLLSLRNIFTTLRQGELPSVTYLSRFATTYLQANWALATSLPRDIHNQYILDTSLLLDAYSQTLSILTTATALEKSSTELVSYIVGSGNADVAQIISLSRLQAEELYQKLSLLDGSLPDTPPVSVPARYASAYQEGKADLATLKRSTTATRSILAVLPEVIGLGGRRKYAVLFQNNLELRPTGGFIGSFAILTFENGKLYDLPIFDVYNVDSQLKGHVEPPLPIKTILGESNWYLRDSNFDPDFPTSARRAEWFIKKTMNIDLDGTLALNAHSLSALLNATGPLNIPDYNEQISAHNLEERAQFHAEGNFFPGSAQKKEFLSTVGSAIFTHLKTLKAGEGIKLAMSLSDSIYSKNTLISLISSPADRVFQNLGWNGELSDLPCPNPTSCYKDYLMVVDSNFGVNKANYYLKRSISEIITIDQSLSVSHTLSLTYANSSPSSAWPAGIYKNYQRLYLPLGTTVGNVKVGQFTLKPSDYTLSAEHNKLVLGYLVTVGVGESTQVEVEYSTPNLPRNPELIYTLHWQKQPGTAMEDPLQIYLNYPASLNPTIISPQAELFSGQLKFNLSNNTDRRLTVKFQR